MEIDFLITREFENSAMKARISPIEAKSGIRYGTVSLNKFKEKFGKRVGMRFVLAPNRWLWIRLRSASHCRCIWRIVCDSVAWLCMIGWQSGWFALCLECWLII